MKLAHTRCFGLAFAISMSFAPDADASFVAVSTPEVSFTAIGPAGLHIVGTTPDLTVQEDGQDVVVTVRLTNLTTGIGLRDKHMREKYLEVQSYPTAVLRLPRVKVQLPASGQSAALDGEGAFTLHGKTKPVGFRYTAKSDGKSVYGVRGTMTIDMNDYGIETPKYLGVSVKPVVDVAVSFTAEDRS